MNFWISITVSLALVGSVMEIVVRRLNAGALPLAQLKALEINGYWIFSAGVLICTISLNRLIASLQREREDFPEPALARVDQGDMPHRSVAFWILFGIAVPFFLIGHTYPPPNLSATFDPINAQEEGVRAAAANQYLHGKRPYRDIYLLYGMGNEIIEPIGIFHFFGMRLSSMRRWACFQEVAGPLALYALGLLVLETPGALIVLALIASFRNPFWVSFRAAWGLIAMCFIMVALKHRDRKAWMIAGSSCVIAFLYSKESGIIPAVAGGLIIIYQMLHTNGKVLRQFLLPFAAGWLILFLPFLLWLGVIGGLPFLVHDLLHPAAAYLSQWSKAAPALEAPLRHALFDPLLFYRPEGVGLRWWFPALFYVLTLAWFLQRPLARRTLQLGVLALFCWLYFLVALGRSDFDHWLKSTSGYWLLMVALIEQIWLARPKAPWSARKMGRAMMGVFSIALLLPVAFEGALLASTFDHLRLWRTAFRNLKAPDNSSLSRMGPRYLAPKESQKWSVIVERIHRWAAPGSSVYVYGDYPVLYFLADVVNPTRYANLNYIVNIPMEKEVIADLERNSPRIIIGEGTMQNLVTPIYAQNIARYIQAHFRPVEAYEGFVIYQRVHLQKIRRES